MISCNPQIWKPKFNILESSIPSSSTHDHHQPRCTIRIVSYNILAQAYVSSNKFKTSPPPSLEWSYRSKANLSLLLSLEADILCLQELDEFHTFFEPALLEKGYEAVYIQRHKKKDGSGIFFLHSKLSLLSKEIIDYNNISPPFSLPSSEEEDAHHDHKQEDLKDVCMRLRRDNVGVVAIYRLVAVPEKILIIGNTHIYWDPVLIEVKSSQVKYLGNHMLEIQMKVKEEFKVDPLLLIGGDFNSLPGDAVYNFMTSNVTPEDPDLGDHGHHHDLEGFIAFKEAHFLNGHSNLEKSCAASSSSSSLRVERVIKNLVTHPLTCTTDRFPLPVVSLYAHVDSEPLATNFTPKFVGTLDYLFFIPSPHQWKPKSVLVLPPPSAPDVVSGLPNYQHPSDHLPIGSDFDIF